MPNADTLGSIFRAELNDLKRIYPDSIILIENFGKANYFNAMYYSSLLIGNTSSGIIEAASFNKYVINVGDRQKGRTHGTNVFNTGFDSVKIIEIFNKLVKEKDVKMDNIYFKKTMGSLPNIFDSFLAIILNMIAYNLIAIKIPIVIFDQEILISTT